MNGDTQQAGIYEGTAGNTVDQVNNNRLIIRNILLYVFFLFSILTLSSFTLLYYDAPLFLFKSTADG